MWRNKSKLLQSKGLTTVNPMGLAGLAEARRQHEGQFFTPETIAHFIWKLITPTLDLALSNCKHRINILDTSVGSGRLLEYADPKKHNIVGIDVDENCIKALVEDANAANFEFEFIHASMDEIKPHGFAVALINPPFSILFENADIQIFPCNTFGKYGACTRAMSHKFALAQSLNAAALVAAILPKTFVDEIKTTPYFKSRLHSIYNLPNNAFESEGATVATAVVLFTPELEAPHQIQEISIHSLDADPPAFCLDLGILPIRANTGHAIRDVKPLITLPVTGDSTVRVIRGGRRIHLKFKCGLTQARVLNAIYQDVLRESFMEDKEMRYPKELKYTGDGALYIHAHLCQPNPLQSFESFVAKIKAAGGTPLVCQSLLGYIRNQTKKLKRHIPFGHTIRACADALTEIVPQASFPINPKKWGSPIIKAGQKYQVQKIDGNYVISIENKEIGTMEAATFEKKFAGINIGSSNGWTHKYPSKTKVFPKLKEQWNKEIEKLGIDKWLTWDYQKDDLAELCMSPKGGIIAWSMGLGKTRLALALCLLRGGKHNLITVEAHLVDEMVSELKNIKLPEDSWQVIRSAEHLNSLRKINVISYNRLRMPVDKSKPNKLFADYLRRRIRVLVADEGQLLRHTDTEQTQALWKVSPGIRFLLSGTPLANYPRDLLGLISFVYGDATVYQPYGLRSFFLTPQLAKTTVGSCRGMDKFRKDFVTLEWVTNEFSENMAQGAKREIPCIANLDAYRELVAPLIKRRVVPEPEVAKYVKIPTPIEKVTTIQWDAEHLAFYRKVADEFRSWYSESKRRAGINSKQINLIALLARIGAVVDAANQPHQDVRNFSCYPPFTSKQRAVIERVKQVVASGQKIITFCHSPKAVNRLAKMASAEGIDNIVMHGQISQAQRTADLQDEFRLGKVPALFASMGVTRTGLNIPEASYVIFYDRDWAAFAERQAKSRVLRPQQKKQVTIEYFHLPGSIDEYQAQMIEFKADAADSGLDWATPTQDPTQFLHLDTVLGRFVSDMQAIKEQQTEVNS